MNSNYFSENVKNQIHEKISKKTVSVPFLIISVLTTIIFVLIIVSKWSDILSFFGIDIESDKQQRIESFYIGDSAYMTGTINNNGDIINYTHTIKSLEFGLIGLNSSKVNLNNYNDEVYIQGIVERIYQGIPIIFVNSIYSLDIDDDFDEDQSKDSMQNESTYLPNIGLYLDSDFFEKYSLLNQGEGGVLKIKENLTNKIININYFVCDKSSNDKNCERFNDMFSQSSEQKFVNSYSVTYYKQAEIKSRFFSNGSLFGYFINDVENDTIKELAKYIQIVNEKFVEKNVLNNIKNLCVKNGKKINKVNSKSLFLRNNNIYYFVEGVDNDNTKIECELRINPTSSSMVAAIDIKVDLNLNQEIDIVQNDNNNLQDNVGFDWSSDVEQFPLNLERSLQFTSRKGHTYVFPSSNIAYAGQSTQENFNQVGVSCYSVMNVVQYSEKDFVNQQGNVKIYECNVKNSFDDSQKSLIYKSLEERHFVIEIVDPTWVDFAKNIKIMID